MEGELTDVKKKTPKHKALNGVTGGDTTSFLWAEPEIQLPQNIKLRIKTLLTQAGFLSRVMLFEGRAL